MEQLGAMKELEIFRVDWVERQHEEEEIEMVIPGSVRESGRDLLVVLQEGYFLRPSLKSDPSLRWIFLEIWPKMRVFSFVP